MRFRFPGDQALGNQNGTKVHATCGTIGNNLSNVCYYIIKSLVLSLNLLTNKGDIGLGLQCALQSNMAGRTAHQLDKVPILAC